MKKKTFLLLEILIAILLVSICLIPLVQSPILSYRAEMSLIEEMEGERIAEWTFSEIKDKLLNHEIPWEKLPTLDNKTSLISLPPMTIDIPGAKLKKIERAFVLRCNKKGEKEGVNGEIYRMLHVDIYFTPKLTQKKKAKGTSDYSYRLMVQKKLQNQNS